MSTNEETLTVDNVVKVIAKVPWRALGEKLSLKQQEFNEIEVEHSSSYISDSCHRRMVETWFNQDKEASWEKLVAALIAIGEHELARGIEDKYVKRRGSDVSMYSIPPSTPSSPMSPMSFESFPSIPENEKEVSKTMTSECSPTEMSELSRPTALKEVINELSSFYVQSKWYDIGIQLGFKSGELDNINANYTKVEAQFRELMNQWLRKVNPAPSWKALCDALRSQAVEEEGAANYLQKKYCSTTDQIDEEESEKRVTRKRKRSSPQPSKETNFRGQNEAMIKDCFASLVEMVADKLEEKKINLKRFHVYLANLFSEKIPKTDSIFDTFEEIGDRKLWNYKDHDFLLRIVAKYAKEDEEIQSGIYAFKEALSHFQAAKKIMKHLNDRSNGEEANPKEPLPEHCLKYYPHKIQGKLKMTITDQTLVYIDELWRNVAEFFILSPLSAILETIEEGCILITWRITAKSEKKIREKIDSAVKFFRENCITRVVIDMECVYDEEKMNEMFLMACHDGNLEEVQTLLDRGLDVNATLKENGYSGIHFAALNANLDLMNLLIVAGAEVYSVDNDGKTALGMALEMGNKEMVEILLAAGEEKSQELEVDGKREDPKKTLRLRWLTQKMRSGFGFVRQKYREIRQDLVGACKDDNIDAVKYILGQGGANVNMTESDKHAWTPIMWATEKGNMEIVKLLILHGANVNAKAKDNKWTSLILASRLGHLKVADLLLKCGAEVDAQTNDGSSALTWALYEGYTEISKLLIERGANVNNMEDNGWTPIMRASNKGLGEMVGLLCKRGADMNHQAQRGWTALMAATNHNHKEVVDVLIEKGVEKDLRMTDTLEPALHVACYRGHSKIAGALITAGSDAKLCNKEGLTPLMVAVNRGHLETVDTLIKGGVDIDQPHEATGWTALFLAAKAGKIVMFRKLLDYGAKTEIEGIKVTDVASYFKRNEILKEVKKSRLPPSIPEVVRYSSLQSRHDPVVPPISKPSVDVEAPDVPPTSIDKHEGTIEEVEPPDETLTKPPDSISSEVGPLPEETTDDKTKSSKTDSYSAQEEPQAQQTEPGMASSPPSEGVPETEVKQEEKSEPDIKEDPEQAPISQPKDVKLNMQQMELILKAFEQRMWKIATQTSNIQQSKQKQIQSIEEIAYQEVL